MNDEQLQLILDSFAKNNNEFVLETENFRIVSDHTLFRVSFLVNDEFVICRTKGENEDIMVSPNLDISKMMFEIKTYMKEKYCQNK